MIVDVKNAVMTIRPNVSALEAVGAESEAQPHRLDRTRAKENSNKPLTRKGVACPPAPSEFIAPQMPGAAKLHNPRMIDAYQVERYQTIFSGVASVV